jgi:hypothetical protein
MDWRIGLDCLDSITSLYVINLISYFFFSFPSFPLRPASVKHGSDFSTLSARTGDRRVRGLVILWTDVEVATLSLYLSLRVSQLVSHWNCVNGWYSFILSSLCSWTMYCISFMYWTVVQGSGNAGACVRTILIMYSNHVFKIGIWMKQGLLFWFLLSPPSSLLRVRTT